LENVVRPLARVDNISVTESHTKVERFTANHDALPGEVGVCFARYCVSGLISSRLLIALRRLTAGTLLRIESGSGVPGCLAIRRRESCPSPRGSSCLLPATIRSGENRESGCVDSEIL
jgi:hypothetical protein